MPFELTDHDLEGRHAPAELGGAFRARRTVAEGDFAGFDDTKACTMNPGVELRFSQHLIEPGMAHETGIFRYFSRRPGQELQMALIHFNTPLVKTPACRVPTTTTRRAPSAAPSARR